jgi:pimeloyl-ACP methyl ester carboxylesterase
MFYESPWGPVYYQISGPEDALVAAFTHGVTMDHRSFDSQVEALKERYLTLVWDLPGHGRSFPLKEKFTYSLAAECLLGVLDEIGTKQAALVGVSLGGQINQYAAFLKPERVAALVEVGSMAIHKPFGRLANILGKLYVASSRLIPEKQVYSWIASSRAINPETRSYVEKKAAQMGKKQILEITEGMFMDMAKGVPVAPEMPLLLIHGEKEMSFVAKHLRSWHEQTHGSRYAVIPEAGHIANQDNPEAFNEALLEFLEECVKQETYV